MAVVRKDKVLSSYDGNLESVKVYDNAGTNQVQTTNGVFVVVEGLLPGEREVKKARLGSTADFDKDLCLIASPEVMADERLYRLADFYIPAGKVARAYRLNNGDIISLTVDLLADTVAVGDKLIIKSNGKLGKDATNLPNAKIVFEVIEDCGYDLHMTTQAFALQVTRQK